MRSPGTRVVVPPPDVSPWETTLREVEALADADGWDQPTSLYWIDLHAGDTVAGMPGLGVLKPPLPPLLGNIAPYQLLDALADLWHGRPPPQEAAAVVVVFEVLGLMVDRDDPAADAAAAAADAAGRLADEPGAREMRIAMMTLLAPQAGVAVLTRVRGEEPGPVTGNMGRGDLLAVGRSLRRLAATVAATMSTRRGHAG